MTASELAARLKAWALEFEALTGNNGIESGSLWVFLATRLSEANLIEDDPDIVTATIAAVPRKVRITGTHGRHLTYAYADGAVGFGIVEMAAIAPNDRGRMTAILERLLADGKIREAQ